MNIKKSAVVGEAKSDTSTDGNDSKIGRKTNMGHEMITSVEKTFDVDSDETKQEWTSSKKNGENQQQINQSKENHVAEIVAKRTEMVVGPPFNTVPYTEKTVVNTESGPQSISVTDGSERILTTMQMGNSSILRFKLKLVNALMEAAVDTGAEVTFISDEVYATLDPKPPVLRETMMHAAGRGMMMKTFVVGPVDLGIGSKSYATEVYVAPIKDAQ
jgi:hypothetical protein